MSARFAISLVVVFASVPARADLSAPLAANNDALPVHTLLGPFASIEAYCEQSRHEDDNLADCTVVHRRGHAAAVVLRWGGRQRQVFVAIEDAAGWWLDGPVLDDANRGRGGFVIEAVGDRPGSAQLRGVQGHWWKPITDEELNRFDHDIYYCLAIELRCWARPNGPVCSDPLPVAGRHDCGLGGEDDAKSFVTGRWDWEQQIRDRAAGRDLEFRRRAWRQFPTDFHGYTEWFEEQLRLARELASTHRRIGVTAR